MTTHALSVGFAPSEVVLHAIPLVGTLGRTEREMAAALIVRACQVNGDTWQPVTPKMIREMLERDAADGVEPMASLNRNPFARPNFWELVAEGYASGDPAKHEPLALTEKALAKIRKYRRPVVPSEDGGANG